MAEAPIEPYPTELVRILVVDDFTRFRQRICSMLKEVPNLQVVGEASDGLEALHKAEELRPDLILLDIGLPRLNGIEAAQRIHGLYPESRIVFLSMEETAEIVEKAFSVGALGYVAKCDVGTDLLAAVESVRVGRRFVSRSLSLL
jgi:two-component system nitrate/nitrite response regulator NarL